MAVVGVEDEAFGQRVAAIVVMADGGEGGGAGGSAGGGAGGGGGGGAGGGEGGGAGGAAGGAAAQDDGGRALLQTLRADCGKRLAPYKPPNRTLPLPLLPHNLILPLTLMKPQPYPNQV